MPSIEEKFYQKIEGTNLENSLFEAEWLLTDGYGGWSSQSVSGSLTRRYHSLFMSNSKQGRINLLPQVDEFISNPNLIPLSTNLYQNAIYPSGHAFLESVWIGPTIKWFFRINGDLFVKELFKSKESKQTFLRYNWYGSLPIKIHIVPLFSFKGFHELSRKRNIDTNVQRVNNGVQISVNGSLRPLSFQAEEMEIEDNDDWYYSFKLKQEQERGLDDTADFFTKFKLNLSIKPNAEKVLCISNEVSKTEAKQAFYQGYERLRRSLAPFQESSDLLHKRAESTLNRNLSDYIITTKRNTKGIVAGYHWFEEWGRDTFITLNYLTDDDLNLNSVHELAYSVFQDFFSVSRDGLLPNRFVDSSNEGVKAEYNSVDALLWAIVSLYRFQKAQKNPLFFREFWNQAFMCVDAYMKGTVYSISNRPLKTSDHLLLWAGDDKTQLTWMDARVDGVPVTPRDGACVEINALWYNVLKMCAEMAKTLGSDSVSLKYEECSASVIRAFRSAFLLSDKGMLADRVKDLEIDVSFRPNQIFALSLPFALLERKEARQLLNNFERELLTDFAIRTLSPIDKCYQPNYGGGPLQRDQAYHQGTAWPWLLAPYCDAVLKFTENDQRPRLEKTIDNLNSHVFKVGCGHVSEVFGGGDDLPGGTIAQAWSLAALRYCISRLKA